MKTSKQTVFYASIWLVSLGLVVGSCEKQLPEAGETIPVRFLLQQAPSGEGESVARSSVSGTGEEASSVVPLGDNLYLYASLEVAPPEPTRDALTFNSDAQIIVAAYEGSSTTATASAVYVVSGSAFIPYNSGPELLVEPGTYTFVAYSYNNISPLTHSASETVSLSPASEDDGDFLWGTTTASVSAGNNAITITMKRRLSRASVKVTTPSTGGPYTISAISDITIGPGHSVDMQLSDGSFTSTASTIPQPVTLLASTTLPSSAVETDLRLVCTNGSSITTVTIGSITVGSGAGRTYTNLTVKFNKQLEPNKSYILRVDIRKGVAWAGSNVYWDGSQLTFKPHGYVGEENNYQGVFFRWGSLVGIDPSYNNMIIWNSSNNTFYVPSYTSPSDHSWATSHFIWNNANIPSLYETDIQNNTGVSVDYFAYNTPDYTNKKGDICRYLSHIDAVSGEYRMPTLNELQYGNSDSSNPTISYSSGNWTSSTPLVNGYWTRIGTTSPTNNWADISSTSTNAEGKYTGLVSGGNYSGYATFPASGYRTGVNGELYEVGSSGYYWSSSAVIGTNSSHFLYLSSSLLNTQAYVRHRGYSVRCVLQE